MLKNPLIFLDPDLKADDTQNLISSSSTTDISVDNCHQDPFNTVWVKKQDTLLLWITS